MSTEKTIYKDASTNVHFSLMLTALSMAGLSLYLTLHYFRVKFPSDITEGSLCDISSFFNCDAATHSALSNIAGVPISAFGLLIGILLFLGYMFAPRKIEGTNYVILAANLVGCIVLFIYSLVVLKTLCPFCSLYYVASAIAFYIFHKYGFIRQLAWQPALVFLVFAGLTFSAFSYNIQQRSQKNSSLAIDLMNQFDQLPKLGEPYQESAFRLASATEKFEDAPLRVTVFSDFQCPACRMLSEVTHQMEKRYEGKINIQYIFYPLDHRCNSAIERPIMQLSCQGAYLSTCLKEDFAKVHDDIFVNQSNLTQDWINRYAKRRGVEECLDDPQTKQEVVDIIELSRPFNVRSTPTMLINGAKIEGVIPPDQLFIIFDELLKRAN